MALTIGPTNFATAAGLPNPSTTSTNKVERQVAACNTPVKTFRCPATTAPERVFGASVYSPAWFANRVPCNNLGVVTGLQPHDGKSASPGGWGRDPGAIAGAKYLGDLDGMFVARPTASSRLSQGGMGGPVGLLGVTDGLSNTLMTGGANFVLGDGSVKFIRDSIDPAVYSGLGTRAQGEVPGEY